MGGLRFGGIFPESVGSPQPFHESDQIGDAGIRFVGSQVPAEVQHQGKIEAGVKGKHPPDRLRADQTGYLETERKLLPGFPAHEKIQASPGLIAPSPLWVKREAEQSAGGVGAAPPA